MKDVISLLTKRRQEHLQRLNRRTGKGNIVAHLIDISARTAEIDLHIDDDERGIFRAQIAVIGPRVGIGFDVGGAFIHAQNLRIRCAAVDHAAAHAVLKPTLKEAGDTEMPLVQIRVAFGRVAEITAE
jgi:hypothetical protein